jgi:short-subunit dehydrogenase
VTSIDTGRAENASREGAGRTALVTGASAGIGRAFAELLAARGYDAILTARRRDRLEAVAAALRQTHGVRVHVIAADLADPAAPAAVVTDITSRGLHVDVLINNAGYGVPGRLTAMPWQTHHAFLRVMVGAVCELSHGLLPGMAERRWGRIVNVASLAGLLPAPAGHTLYAASKAFLIRFSEALSEEYAADGVHVTALCPGFTLSEFHDVTGTRDQVNRLPKWMWMDSPTVAEEGYRAVMRGDAVWVSGRVNQTIAWLARHAPQPLVRRAVALSGRRYRKA